MIQWSNFVVFSKFAKNSEGHLPADKLWEKILKHGGGEAYHCAFDLEPRDTFKGYQGLVRPALGCVWFDFDYEPDPDLALKEARALVNWLGVTDTFNFFSGSKGIHIGVPAGYFGLSPSNILCDRLHDLACELAKDWESLDTSVYNANRKFRLPHSKHPKTGLYKVQLKLEQLQGWSLSEIQEFAKKPQTLKLPETKEREPLACLVDILTKTKDTVYARASDKGEFTPFERHPDKKCIQALEIERAAQGQKQAVVMRLVSDYFNRGLHLEDARSRITQWMKANQIKDDKPLKTLEQIYGGESYSYGCLDSYKSIRCAGRKCAIYKNLSPARRPRAVDVTEKQKAENLGVDKPSEAQLAKQILEEYGGNLVAQEKDLFEYTGTHWKHLGYAETMGIQATLQTLLEKEGLPCTSHHAKSLFNTLLLYTPHVEEGVNLFMPHPFVVNFKNGTLHLLPKANGSGYHYTTEFKEHRTKDYIINVLPFNYDEGNKEENTEFLAVLDRIFQGDVDKEEKIWALKQMYGACLSPVFPHLFLIHGLASTGKSTLIMTAMKLVDKENISSVQPHLFNREFYLAPMLGKLVNIHTDIDTNHPLSDAQVKQIVDRVPVLVNRKGTTMISAPLPGVHIFGANALPPTLDGVSKAHDRRWTFIECRHLQNQGKVSPGFDDWLYKKSPQGILNFALEGLRSLLDNPGQYVNPSSGKETMTDWQKGADPVALFLEAVESGEVCKNDVLGNPDKDKQISLDSECWMHRTELYEAFLSWGKRAGYRYVPLRQHEFYGALQGKGFRLKKTGGTRGVEGFRVAEGRPAPF